MQSYYVLEKTYIRLVLFLIKCSQLSLLTMSSPIKSGNNGLFKKDLLGSTYDDTMQVIAGLLDVFVCKNLHSVLRDYFTEPFAFE